MSEAKHTPTPWKSDCFLIVAPGKTDSMSSVYGGRSVAHTGQGFGEGKESEANAKFIVRACNSHYELVEALESMLSRFGHLGTDPGKRDAIETAENALKKATASTD